MPGGHRKTRRRYEIPLQVRYLTFSCFQCLPLLRRAGIKDTFVETLAEVRDRRGFLLHGYVVMHEHVHLLVTPDLPDDPVPNLLSDLKSRVAGRVLQRWRAVRAPILHRLIDSQGKHRFWQRGGGYDHNIWSGDRYLEKLQYIHDNPARRGLVSRAIDWRWSSARWYAGERTRDVLEMDPVTV